MKDKVMDKNKPNLQLLDLQELAKYRKYGWVLVILGFIPAETRKHLSAKPNLKGELIPRGSCYNLPMVPLTWLHQF